MSRLEKLGELVSEEEDARRSPAPDPPGIGPFRREFWRSPLRGQWLTSFFGSMMLPFFAIAALTGFLSHAAYNPGLGANDFSGGFDVDLYFFDWPTQPVWLYSLTQSLHVIAGFAVIPILLAKLWSVIPRLFERPPVRSLAHSLERLSVLLLVGTSIFLLVTGVINVEYWLAPLGFSFLPAHYYAAMVFLGALALHLVLKLPVAAAAFIAEAAAYAIRIDVAEELARLRAHLDEVERLLARGGVLGKRLDFLMQELHREANTLGSKSAALELTNISVDMKVAIEQMREQVQNIE